MKITSIRITEIKDSKTRLKAIVNVTFDEMFAVSGLKILESEIGYFMAMPSKQLKDGRFVDIAHPINKESRAVFEKLLLWGYEFVLQNKCTSIDMILDNFQCADLYEQKPSDFSVNVIY